MSNTLNNYAKEFEIDRNGTGKKEKLAYQSMANIIREVSNHYHNDLGKEIRETYLEMVSSLDKLSSMCAKKEVNEDDFDEAQFFVGSCASELMGLLDEYSAEVKNDEVVENDYAQAVMIEHFFRQ